MGGALLGFIQRLRQRRVSRIGAWLVDKRGGGMTAEVAIVNRNGIALAADSAVTIVGAGGASYVFGTVNKIFRLREDLPVGIMLYGRTDCSKVPWELIIGSFVDRTRSSSWRFDALQGYVSKFIDFIQSEPFMNKAQIKSGVVEYLRRFLEVMVIEKVESEIREWFENQGYASQIPKDLVREFLREVITDVKDRLDRCPARENIESSWKKTALDALRDEFDSLVGGPLFANMGIEVRCQENLREILGKVLFVNTHAEDSGTHEPIFILEDLNSVKSTTGIVFAGYGDRELYPSLVTIEVDYFLEGRLIYRTVPGRSMDMNRPDEAPRVEPFAQSYDVVRAFTEGVDPVFSDYADTLFLETVIGFADNVSKHFLKVLQAVPVGDARMATFQTLPERIRVGAGKLVAMVSENMKDKRHKLFIAPVSEVLGHMPVTDMGKMAETLVNLTLFRAQFLGQQERVRGPVDVVLITKFGGFSWVKCKNGSNRDR